MRILLRSIHIIDPSSAFHQLTPNILIHQGQIVYIGPEEKDHDLLITGEGLCVSGGWVDMRCWVGDPGLEYKEDFESAAATAAKGGFTQVVCMPDVEPVHQTKNAIAYIQSKSKTLPVDFLASAAVSMDAEGKDLTEMIDLYKAGAVAFTDGDRGIQGGDLLIKALQYAQYFNGLVIQRPQDSKISQHGLMHEGITSTQLGLKGIPALAEEIMVARDLQILAYTAGKLHFSLLSSAGSINLIRKAKVAGLPVTCDVAAYQIAFTDEDVIDFDTNYKVDPPYRSEQDQQAIIEGLRDGTIDVLVSNHKPQDTESKKLEFDQAEFGIINLETAFAVANTFLGNKLNTEEIVNKFTREPRKILGLPAYTIKEGEPANLTIFAPEKEWTPKGDHNLSRSQNSPFFGKTLKGQVLGIIYKKQFVRNNEF